MRNLVGIGLVPTVTRGNPYNPQVFSMDMSWIKGRKKV